MWNFKGRKISAKDGMMFKNIKAKNVHEKIILAMVKF